MRRIPTKLNQKCKCKMIFVQTWSKYLNLHYLVPLSAKFYQFFIFTYDFDTDLFLSTSCSQLISGEPLVSCIHSTYISMVAFALIPLKKTWNCNLFVFNFFQPSFSTVSTTLKKIKTNIWHYILIAVNFWHYSLIAVIILNIIWPEQVHLRTPFFTADNCREVVIQM